MPPAADVAVDAVLARRLLEDQHPDLAHLPLVPVGAGWDNAVLRLGDGLALRLPRRAVAADLIRHEQRVLPRIAARLPVAVPAPVRIGRPSDRFPRPWSVVPWFAGDTVVAAGLRGDPALADDLAGVLAALHRPVADAPENPYRGVPLAQRSADVAARLASGALPHPDRLRERWLEALAAPPWPGPPLQLHGDLHPANLIAAAGRLRAVIDFGDTTAGDPATDVATAWLTFDATARSRFRAALRPDGATWTRARGWALVMASAMVVDGSPVTAAIGATALQEVLQDA